jgi:hypothetical protein
MNYFLLFLLFFQLTSEPENPGTRSNPSPLALLEEMVERYQDSWYSYLTFDQKTTFYDQNGDVERTQWWFEALQAPGALAIHFDEKKSGNGILFHEGNQYGYANGEKIQELARIHDLLVLGFDVYKQSPEKTREQLEMVGYDMTKMYEDEWQGKAVWVVGVDAPSNDAPQFWIEQDRLLFVRSIKPGRAGTVQEVQFNRYEPVKGGWVAPEVVFNMNGKRMLYEEYFNIQAPTVLDSAIFKPDTFLEASW